MQADIPNKISTMDELAFFFNNYDEIYFYGVGEVGKLLLSYTKKSRNLNKVYGFIVSERKEECSQIGGLHIFLADSWFKENCGRKDNRIAILITTSQKYQIEIYEGLKHRNCEFEIGHVSDAMISTLWYFESNSAKQAASWLPLLIEKRLPNTELCFSVPLCGHCNLNCAGCNAFAPLASESYLDIKGFENDIKRLAYLSDGEAYLIQLMGGEPLLNPNAIDYAMIARENFAKARISFVTNGLLLRQQPDDFFEKCAKYKIDFDMTPYPINIDYEELGKWLEKLGEKYGGDLHWKYQDGSAVKIMRKEPFILNPDVPRCKANYNWLNCYMANICVQLRDGKMMCTKISNAQFFMDYFKNETNRMHFSKGDFLDIYQVHSVKEIFEFFAKPFPFCKYCKVDSIEKGVPWRQSSKKIEEWV